MGKLALINGVVGRAVFLLGALTHVYVGATGSIVRFYSHYLFSPASMPPSLCSNASHPAPSYVAAVTGRWAEGTIVWRIASCGQVSPWRTSRGQIKVALTPLHP